MVKRFLTICCLLLSHLLSKNERYQFGGSGDTQVAIINLLLASKAPINIGKETPLAILRRQEKPCQEAIDLLIKARAAEANTRQTSPRTSVRNTSGFFHYSLNVAEASVGCQEEVDSNVSHGLR